MTTSRLIVRAPEGAWQGEVDSWTALVVLGALTAAPESLGELAEAVRRYQPEHQLFDRPRQTAGDGEAIACGSWCLVDLTGRTVVAGGEFELPEPRGAYEPEPGEQAEGFPVVWLDTPADWLFRQAGDDWRQVAATRAAARAAVGPVDARAVLFGSPLLEHLADGVLATAADVSADEGRQLARTRAIHAAWLMTPRSDLGGCTPRELLLADRERIVCDLEHRSRQWSMQGHAAHGLAPESMAYRFGGFGTTEVVLYFDLVRALLADAWDFTKQGSQPARRLLVERLAEFRDTWLHEPNASIGSLETPAELIESERRRMPVTSDGNHLDCDCPICQAEAAGELGTGPAFMWFDGHHLELEDEFGFSLSATRAEWEREQDEYRKFSEEMDRKERERAAAGADAADPLVGPVWQSSFVDWDAVAGPEASPLRPLLALSFPLAELTGDLRERPAGTDLMRSLNGAYAALRASQDAVATNSAAQEFRELLETAGRKFPDLTAKCADLQSRLDEVLRRLF